MTDPGERKGRTRHVLRRSSSGEGKAADPTVEAPVSAAVEPDSGLLELPAAAPDTVEAPTIDEKGETSEEPVDIEVDDEPAQIRGGTAAKVFAFGVVPALAVILAVAVGWLTYTAMRASRIEAAGTEAIQAAKDSTVALLSYNPDTVEQQLTDARSLLTGEFRDSYTTLTNDVVIPGAEQQRISAVATVPRAASVSTEIGHAVVLVFVNQTVVVDNAEPTATLSSVRVILDKVDGKWLISKFDPV